MESTMSDTAVAVLTEFRQEGKLCDVVIKVDDAEFNAHKIILCSCSEYFRTLFTGAWATSNTQVCNVPGVSPEIMHLIIDYAYTHTVPVTEDNVVEVLAAAGQFMVPGIVQSCCHFLKGQLCPANCISILRLADFYNCSELKHEALLYILYHFQEIICVSRELLELSAQQLAAVIENDHLNVNKENTVFEVILRWINHLPDQRRHHISALLPKVRLGLMTPGYLQYDVIGNEMVMGSSECVPIINAALTARCHVRTNRPSAYTNPLSRPRLPSDILLVTGGKDSNAAASSLEAHDARTNSWVTMSAGVSRAHHGTAVLNGSVYLIGGCNRLSNLNTVQRFDPVTCTWHDMAPMNSCRCYVSVAVLNGCIYAMGGSNGQVYFKTVECYRPETDRWTMMASMHIKRSGASAAALNGKVYICGGYDGRRSLCRAECYDPNTNLWTMIAPMSRYRSALGVAAYRDHIYAVGGTVCGNTNLRSVEAYDPQTNRWSKRPAMYMPRSYFGIEVVNDHIFVIGGHNGSTTVSAVERYSEDTYAWDAACSIETPRSGLCCCVLRGLHGVAEKLFPRAPLTPPSVEEAQS